MKNQLPSLIGPGFLVCYGLWALETISRLGLTMEYGIIVYASHDYKIGVSICKKNMTCANCRCGLISIGAAVGFFVCVFCCVVHLCLFICICLFV